MRVLAVTGNASLVVALGSMMRDWEVVSVRTPEEAASSGEDAIVALIDSGDTDAGLAVAERLYDIGILIPAVVIGDQASDANHVSILVRPFSLEDLTSAVQEASKRVVERPSMTRTVEETEEAEPAEDAGLTEADGQAALSEPEQPGALESERKSPPDADAPAERMKPAPAGPVEQRSARPLSVVRPDVPVRTPATPTPAATPPAQPSPISETRPVARPPAGQPAAAQQPAASAPAAVTAATPAAPQAPHPPAQPPAPAPSGRTAAATSAAVVETDVPAVEQGRRRFRRKSGTIRPEATEPPLVRRLKAAARQLQDVGAILQELPVLQDLRAMADALVGEVEAQFGAPVVSVLMRDPEGFHSVAFRGLSRVEAGMVVPETQPLFNDVLATREGILIQPVDLAQGLVAGIGGARTEALMAAPAVFQGECFAIIVVGGDRFGESDLDRLSDLALEAAPGLAVAQLLQRLRDRG